MHMKALLLIQIGRDHFHQSLLSTGGFNSSLPSEYLLKSQLPSRTALGLVCLKGTLLLRRSWLGCLVHPGAGLTAFTTAQIKIYFPQKKGVKAERGVSSAQICQALLACFSVHVVYYRVLKAMTAPGHY